MCVAGTSSVAVRWSWISELRGHLSLLHSSWQASSGPYSLSSALTMTTSIIELCWSRSGLTLFIKYLTGFSYLSAFYQSNN